MTNNIGLAVNPGPPPELKHAQDATYLICSECGREIWDDMGDEWLEGRFGALCSCCMDRCKN